MAFFSWVKHPFYAISLILTNDIGTQEKRVFKSPLDIYYHAEANGVFEIFRGFGVSFLMYAYLWARTLLYIRQTEQDP